MPAEFSSQRETETLTKCEDVLNHLDELAKYILAGPRLTAREEAFRQSSLQAIRHPYEELARACRRNLRANPRT